MAPHSSEIEGHNRDTKAESFSSHTKELDLSRSSDKYAENLVKASNYHKSHKSQLNEELLRAKYNSLIDSSRDIDSDNDRNGSPDSPTDLTDKESPYSQRLQSNLSRFSSPFSSPDHRLAFSLESANFVRDRLGLQSTASLPAIDEDLLRRRYSLENSPRERNVRVEERVVSPPRSSGASSQPTSPDSSTLQVDYACIM